MTDQQAREILLSYRPGSAAADDPAVDQALTAVNGSPELRQWFDQHCIAQKAITTAFRKTPVPAGLKEQILSERKAHTSFWPKSPARLAAALAVLVAIVGIAVFELGPERAMLDQSSFTKYRQHMVYSAVEAYRMDLETNHLDAVRSYFTGKKALADWTVPKGLASAALTGCGVINWQGNEVSMICFHSGKALAAGQKTDIWLFVIDKNAPHHVPATAQPEFSQVSPLTTASWTEGDKTYLLAVQGDEKMLQSLL